MIHFDGERSFPLPVADVATKLSDASFLVSCQANVTELISATADRAVWKLRPGFAFVRGTLEVTMDIVERIPNTSTKIKMFSKGIGASTTVISELKFEQIETGTRVRWVADITEITGLLRMVPKGLIQSAAGKVITETWSEIEAKLK